MHSFRQRLEGMRVRFETVVWETYILAANDYDRMVAVDNGYGNSVYVLVAAAVVVVWHLLKTSSSDG